MIKIFNLCLNLNGLFRAMGQTFELNDPSEENLLSKGQKVLSQEGKITGNYRRLLSAITSIRARNLSSFSSELHSYCVMNRMMK